MYRIVSFIALSFLPVACQSTPSNQLDVQEDPSSPSTQVRSWGGMREVMRNGKTQGRVQLSKVVGPNSFAVGALEGMAAEITVMAGEIHLAEVKQVDGKDVYNARMADVGDQATLFVIADVETWTEHVLPPALDLKSFEASVKTIAAANGHDIAQPFPFRVESTAAELHLHVLNHSCPIANPEGPAPWRHTSQNQPVTLIGFYAQDAGGLLTHHGQSTHIHAHLPKQGISGHVDALSFLKESRLFLSIQ
ncbi:MAG: hypothetical protein P1V35_04410 [Planctomycetota bacterium]|nr:hypothetical protein [Planctomycetota bacterium]